MTSAFVCAIAMTSATGMAQERTAEGALDTQVSWSALTNKIDGVNSSVTLLNTKIDASVVCGKKRMFYAPGATGADASGCLAPAVTTLPPPPVTVPPATVPPPPPPVVVVPPPPPPPPPKVLTAIGGGNCSVTRCPDGNYSCGGYQTSAGWCASTWAFWGVGTSGGCSEGTSTYTSNGYSFTCTGYR